MMIKTAVALLLTCSTSSFCYAAEQKTFILYDSWKGQQGDDDFRKRGVVQMNVNEGGDVQLTLENQAAVPPSTLLEGLYQLKLVDEAHPEEYALTSVSACQLRRANYRDELTLTLGPSGSILSLAYVPLVSPLARSCHDLEATTPNQETFDSKISWEAATPAMTLPVLFPSTKPPGGLSFFPRTAANSMGQQPQEEQEKPQGFFRKYWYVLAAFMVMNFIQSNAGEEAVASSSSSSGGGEGGTSSGGGGSAGASSPAAASSSSGGGARRRGKRG